MKMALKISKITNIETFSHLVGYNLITYNTLASGSNLFDVSTIYSECKPDSFAVQNDLGLSTV